MSTYTKISSAQFSRTKMELGTIHCSGSVISRTQQFLEERSGESLRPKEVSLRFPVISTYNSEMICRSSDLDITHSRPGSLEPGSRFSIRSSSRIEESAQECGVLPRTNPSARVRMYGVHVRTLPLSSKSDKTALHTHYLILCFHSYPEIFIQSVLNLNSLKLMLLFSD